MGECRDVLQACSFKGIQNLDDDAEWRIAIGLERNWSVGLCVASSSQGFTERVEGGGFVVEGNLIGIFDPKDKRLGVFSGGGFSGLGVGEVDLKAGLGFPEVCGDDEKNEEDRQNINEGNHIDHRTAALACIELHRARASGGGLVEFGQKVGRYGFHFHGHHLDPALEIAMGDQAWNGYRESNYCSVQGLGDTLGDNNWVS